jgi:hypothetical protein
VILRGAVPALLLAVGPFALAAVPVAAELPAPVAAALGVCLQSGDSFGDRVAALVAAGWPVADDLGPQGPMAGFMPGRVVLYDPLDYPTWDDARALRRLERNGPDLVATLPGGSVHWRKDSGVVEISPAAIMGKTSCELAVQGIGIDDLALYLGTAPRSRRQHPTPEGAAYPFAYEVAAIMVGDAVLSVMDFAPEAFGGLDAPTQITTPLVSAE